MATCFCAYVRKMRELEILPLLTYGEDSSATKQNFEAIKGLLDATSPLKYTRESIIRDQIMEYGVGSNQDLIDEEIDNAATPIEEQGVFHAPFFFEK